MKKLNKIFIAAALGLGLCSPEVYSSESDIRQVIHERIVAKLNSMNQQQKSPQNLQKVLTDVLEEIKTILKDYPNDPSLATFKQAVEKINPKQLATMLSYVKIILNYLKPETKNTILGILPTQYKIIIEKL